MPTGPRVLIENACYHIFSRGNHKERVFLDEDDFRAYILRLRKCKKRLGFLLYGFCLMPNHVHLVGQPRHAKDLAKFMQILNRSYTAYFNKRHKKVGHLWQGRFKSKAVTKDIYLVDCIQYIELNPVRAKLAQKPADYLWSSYGERVLYRTLSLKMLDELRI